MPGKHSAKEKRMASHVEESERKRGRSSEDAERIAWSTVNSRRKGKKLKKELPAGEAYPAMGKADDVSSPVMATPSPRRRPEKPTIKMKPITNAEASANLRAGKYYEKSFKVLTPEEMAGDLGSGPALLIKADASPPPAHWKPSWHPPAMTSHYAVHGVHADPKKKYKTKQRARRAADKLDLKHGRVAHQVYAVPHGDAKKAVPPPIPAAAKREPLHRVQAQLNTATSVVSRKPAKTYLPGVHDPKDPARKTTGLRKPKMKAFPAIIASETAADKLQKPGTTASLMSSVKDSDLKKRKHMDKAELTTAKRKKIKGKNFALPGRRYPIEDAAHARNALARVSQHGTAEEQKKVRAKVHHKYPEMGKSFQGDPMNINDLFKAELEVGVDGSDKVLIECPHCDAPITKSQVIAKARGAGKEAAIEGEGSKATADAHVVHQNGKDGGATRTKGKSVLDPSRTGEGAMSAGHPVGEKRAADKVVGVQNNKGSEAHKAMADSDSSSDEESTAKSQKSGPIVRGTPWVQYVDSGEDAWIAKSIAEGTLGEQPTQPLDKNNRRT